MKDFFARLSMQSNGVGMDVRPLTPSLFAPFVAPALDDQPPRYRSQAPLIDVAPTVTDLVDSPTQMTDLELPPELVPEHARQLALPHTFLHQIASIPVTAQTPVETVILGEVEEVVGIGFVPTASAVGQEGMDSQTAQRVLREPSQDHTNIVPLHENMTKGNEMEEVAGTGLVPIGENDHQGRDGLNLSSIPQYLDVEHSSTHYSIDVGLASTPDRGQSHPPIPNIHRSLEVASLVMKQEGMSSQSALHALQELSQEPTDIVLLHEDRPRTPVGSTPNQINIGKDEVTRSYHVVGTEIVPALPMVQELSQDHTDIVPLHEGGSIVPTDNNSYQPNVGEKEETRREHLVGAELAPALLTAQERDDGLVPPTPMESQEKADIRLISARQMQGKVPPEHSASMRTKATNVVMPSPGRQSAPSVIMPLLVVQPEVSVQVGNNAFSREEQNGQATATRSTVLTQVVRRGQSILADEQPVTNKNAAIGQQSTDQEPQPHIQVRIGRIEVRATPPASTPTRQRAGIPKPTLTLSEYLQQRKGELQ
jgi:hypothetical protein